MPTAERYPHKITATLSPCVPAYCASAVFHHPSVRCQPALLQRPTLVQKEGTYKVESKRYWHKTQRQKRQQKWAPSLFAGYRTLPAQTGERQLRMRSE